VQKGLDKDIGIGKRQARPTDTACRQIRLWVAASACLANGRLGTRTVQVDNILQRKLIIRTRLTLFGKVRRTIRDEITAIFAQGAWWNSIGTTARPLIVHVRVAFARVEWNKQSLVVGIGTKVGKVADTRLPTLSATVADGARRASPSIRTTTDDGKAALTLAHALGTVGGKGAEEGIVSLACIQFSNGLVGKSNRRSITANRARRWHARASAGHSDVDIVPVGLQIGNTLVGVGSGRGAELDPVAQLHVDVPEWVGRPSIGANITGVIEGGVAPTEQRVFPLLEAGASAWVEAREQCNYLFANTSLRRVARKHGLVSISAEGAL
jgi:hypothetical protein